MTSASLEDRVASLEAQMSQLIRGQREPVHKNWRNTLGMFSGDEIMWQICQNALAFRDADRREAVDEVDGDEHRQP